MNEPDYLFGGEIIIKGAVQHFNLKELEQIIKSKNSPHVWLLENGLLVYGYRTGIKNHPEFIGLGVYHHTQGW